MTASATREPARFVQQPAGPGCFDVAGFVAAVETRDADRWGSYFAPDSEWLSYRHSNSVRDPHIRSGNLAIHDYLRTVCASGAHLHIEDLVAVDEAVWFRRMVRLDDGRMLIEHVHLKLNGAEIVREIDVESWDFA